jgi:hypothetical protein
MQQRRFDAGFDAVGERAVGRRGVFVECVQRGEQGFFVAAGEQTADQRIQTVFPESILDPAGGFAEPGGQANQLFGVRGLPGAP